MPPKETGHTPVYYAMIGDTYHCYGQECRDTFLDECEEEEEMEIKLSATACAPTRAHSTDAGLDLRSPINDVVKAHDSLRINTGVHVKLPAGTCGLLVSKSGLNVYSGITSTGLIDEGYTGSIIVKLYNNSNEDYEIHRGDKISQLVILPVVIPDSIVLVEDMDDTERGEDGFGSSGKA